MILMQDLSKKSQVSLLCFSNLSFNSPNPLELWFKNAKFGFWKPQKHYSYVLIFGGREGVKKFTKCPYFLCPYLGVEGGGQSK